MRRFTLCLLATLLVAVSWAGQSMQLTILHTNDLHGMLLPFAYTLQTPYARQDAGGWARRATAIAQIRQAAKHPVIVIDSGDFFARGPWHLRFAGMPEIDALNLMGYDMLCIGNTDYHARFGPKAHEAMFALIRRSRFPWLAANLTVGETGMPVPGIQPFIVRVYDEVRVGFLGLTAASAADFTQTKGWTISDPIATAKQWVPLARKECDILIAVTHIGVELDKKLAAAVPGIDAIVGGDSHTFLPTPLLVKNPNGTAVPIVQAGEQGIMLGRLDLAFEHDNGWTLTRSAGALIPIDNTFPDDPALKALLDRWLAP